MNISLQICANLAVLAEPFLPFTASKLNKMLNLPTKKWNEAGHTNMISSGHHINKPSLLFEKVEDSVINQQLEKLENTRKANEAAEAKTQPALENIEFDDFSKIDLRTGTILEAEKVAKTKKLLKLKVDTGIDQRIVVSGIAEHYKPEDIIGKQVCIMVNLAPRKIKGIESQGMILMAENFDGKLSFMSPDSIIKNGSEIK